MANRNIRFIPKRTAVSGRIPTGTTGTEINYIKQGELALNTADHKLFSYDGVNVFEIGSAFTGGTILGDFLSPNISATTYYSGTTLLDSLFARTVHNHVINDVIGLQTQLNNKAELSGDTFTGNVLVPALSATTFLQLTNSSTPAATTSGLRMFGSSSRLVLARRNNANSADITHQLNFGDTSAQFTFPSSTDTLAGLGAVQTFTQTNTFTQGIFATQGIVSSNLIGSSSDAINVAVQSNSTNSVNIGGVFNGFTYSTSINSASKSSGVNIITSNNVGAGGTGDITLRNGGTTSSRGSIILDTNSLQINNISGTTSRMVEADKVGTISASEEIVPLYIFNYSAQTLLNTSSNWTAANIYSGTSLSGFNLSQGQYFVDSLYFYTMNSNTEPIRIPRHRVERRMYNNYATYTNSGSAITNFITYNLPAATLNKDNDSVEINMVGGFTTTSSADFIFKIRGDTIFSKTGQTTANYSFDVSIKMIRTSSNNQLITVKYVSNDPSNLTNVFYYSKTYTDTSVIPIAVTGQDTTSNKVTLKIFDINYKPSV